jgi:hypothetical protein
MLVRGTVAATRLARRLRGRPSPISADPTLSLVGLFETASGLGVIARSMRGVLADGSPQLVSISELSRTPRVPDGTLDVLTPRSAGACQTDVAIHAYNPDVFLAAVRRCGTGFLTAARVNIALAIEQGDSAESVLAQVNLGKRQPRLAPSLAAAIREGLGRDPSTLPRRPRAERIHLSQAEIERQDRIKAHRDAAATRLAIGIVDEQPSSRKRRPRATKGEYPP